MVRKNNLNKYYANKFRIDKETNIKFDLVHSGMSTRHIADKYEVSEQVVLDLLDDLKF